jgi:hypothetical protein
MEQHLIEDAVWQRMLAALETVPYMHCRDLDRLRRFISACFVVMRTNLTWAELGGLVPSAETAKKRFRRWARRFCCTKRREGRVRPADGVLAARCCPGRAAHR